MYWSKTRARLTGAVEQTWNVLNRKRRKEERSRRMNNESYPVPDWDALVAGLARHLKVHEPQVETKVNELYISHALIVRALDAMNPAQRKAFFELQMEFDSVMSHGEFPDKRLAGPARTVAALGLANTAGFGLYAASSTALGFITHAVGITLPFAAYTGLSSTIAFLIGPAGWLTVGVYAFWKVTSTNWTRLAPAIVYVINARAANRLKSQCWWQR